VVVVVVVVAGVATAAVGEDVVGAVVVVAAEIAAIGANCPAPALPAQKIPKRDPDSLRVALSISPPASARRSQSW